MNGLQTGDRHCPIRSTRCETVKLREACLSPTCANLCRAVSVRSGLD